MARPRKKPSDYDVMIARESGVVNLDGEEILIRAGVTRAHAGSEIVRAFPGYWKPVDVHFPIERRSAVESGA